MDKHFEFMKDELGTDDVVLGAGKTKAAAYRDALNQLPDGKKKRDYADFKRYDDKVDELFNICYIGFTQKEATKKNKKEKPPRANGELLYNGPSLSKF